MNTFSPNKNIQEDRPFHPNHHLLDQYKSSDDILRKFDEKFSSNYFWYNCWLFLMIAVSGYAFAYSFENLKNAFKYSPPNVIFTNFRDFTFYTSIFAQFILEKWAVFSKNLTLANIALKLMIVNTIISFGLAVCLGYGLRQTYVEVPREDVGFIRGVFISAIFIASVFTITNILFTIVPAKKIRDDLREREAIKATHKVSQAK